MQLQMDKEVNIKEIKKLNKKFIIQMFLANVEKLLLPNRI